MKRSIVKCFDPCEWEKYGRQITEWYIARKNRNAPFIAFYCGWQYEFIFEREVVLCIRNGEKLGDVTKNIKCLDMFRTSIISASTKYRKDKEDLMIFRDKLRKIADADIDLPPYISGMIQNIGFCTENIGKSDYVYAMDTWVGVHLYSEKRELMIDEDGTFIRPIRCIYLSNITGQTGKIAEFLREKYVDCRHQCIELSAKARRKYADIVVETRENKDDFAEICRQRWCKLPC